MIGIARHYWAFIEISDPWDAKNTIRATLGTAEMLV
jgi:hypothetical protein